MPTISYADAGTPLLWAMSIHLYTSNIIAAIIESIVIYIFYKNYKYYIVFLIILLGNIVSALAGYFLYSFILNIKRYQIIDETTLKSSIVTFGILLFATYIVSILIEFPFFIWASPKYVSYKKTFLLDVISNLFSYVVLIFIYIIFMGLIIGHL